MKVEWFDAKNLMPIDDNAPYGYLVIPKGCDLPYPARYNMEARRFEVIVRTTFGPGEGAYAVLGSGETVTATGIVQYVQVPVDSWTPVPDEAFFNNGDSQKT